MTEAPILYTKNSTKKFKVWQDGYILYDSGSRKIYLKDSEKGLLSCHPILPSQWISHSVIDIGTYLIQTENLPSLVAGANESNAICKSYANLTEGQGREKSLSYQPQPDNNSIDKKNMHLKPPPVKYNYITVPKDGVAISILYTNQKMKKAKTWQDGILYYYEGKNKSILYDSCMSFLDSLVMDRLDKLKEADYLESERFLIKWNEDDNFIFQEEDKCKKYRKMSSSLLGEDLFFSSENKNNELGGENRGIRSIKDVMERLKKSIPVDILFNEISSQGSLKKWKEGHLYYYPDSSQMVLRDDNHVCREKFCVEDLSFFLEASEIKSMDHEIQLDCLNKPTSCSSKDFIKASEMIYHSSKFTDLAS